MDCLYGEQSHLRNKLDEEGLVYIADIPRDTRVWITMPQTGVPERNGDRGRIPSRKRVLDGDPPIEVQKLKDQIQDYYQGYRAKGAPDRDRSSTSPSGRGQTPRQRTMAHNQKRDRKLYIQVPAIELIS